MILEIVCEDIEPFLRVLHYIINIIKIVIPIVLILLITIDIVKVIMGRDKDFTEVKPKIFKRLIYGMLIFLVPTIISMLFKTVFNGDSNELTGPKAWLECYSIVNTNDKTYVPSTNLSCDDVNVIMKVGETYNLNCKVSSDKTLTYESSSNILSLNYNRITALKEGYAVVNILADNRYTNVSVTILKNTIDVTGFSVNNKNVNLEVAESFIVKYNFVPQDATIKKVTYSNYDTQVIKIEGDTITGLKEGETKVRACSNNQICDDFIVNVKKRDVCDNDFIKPNISVDNKYLASSYKKMNSISYENIEFKVNVSDNCSIKNISYCLKKVNENDMCDSNIVIRNNSIITLNKEGEYKIIITAVDQSGNSLTNIYYAKRALKEEELPKEIEDKHDYTCYLGYTCNKGYYYINYDELLGSCYEDTKFLFINTGRKRLGYPSPKFYGDISLLNDAINKKNTGLVSGWDDAKKTYRFIYKCDTICDLASTNNCIGYAYYDPTISKIIENSEVVDSWSYFTYLEK